jgi:hypothetical protein
MDGWWLVISTTRQTVSGSEKVEESGRVVSLAASPFCHCWDQKRVATIGREKELSHSASGSGQCDKSKGLGLACLSSVQLLVQATFT